MFSYNPNESNLRKASELARSQIGIWEKLLALRVSSQRVIDLANKLPPISHEFIVENLVEKNKENDLEAVYQSLISGLLGMNSTLIESLDVQNEESTQNKGTTDPDALWDQIEGLTNRFEDKWSTILNRWHSKINFGSEKLKNKLKVFNVSLMSQVDDLILDDKRNLDKSRIPIYESERVGIESFAKQLEENPDALERELLETHGIYVEKKLEIDDSMLSASLLKQQKNQQKKRKMFDLEVYDDRPFYSQLLNTFISSHADAVKSTTSHMSQADIETLRKYKRKKQKVERKASKGRKIRYNVHAKLQNFMFPIPSLQVESSLNTDRLMASLFQ